MGSYDILMLLVVLVAAYLGWVKGMAWQVASIGAIVGSYFIAMQFRDPVAQHIDLAPPMNTFAAMLLIYLGASIVIWLMFRVVRQSIEQMKLRDFDRQMGALVGAAKGGLIACLITLFAVALLPEQQAQAIIGSKSGLFIAKFLHQAKPVMPEELQEVIGPHLERLKLGPGANPYALPDDSYADQPAAASQQPPHEPPQQDDLSDPYVLPEVWPPADRYGRRDGNDQPQYLPPSTPTTARRPN